MQLYACGTSYIDSVILGRVWVTISIISILTCVHLGSLGTLGGFLPHVEMTTNDNKQRSWIPTLFNTECRHVGDLNISPLWRHQTQETHIQVANGAALGSFATPLRSVLLAVHECSSPSLPFTPQPKVR